jgi:hypothetical protein
MFGGLTISLILPKLIRSVARDGILNFLLGAFSGAPAFFTQRHKASRPLFRGWPANPKPNFANGS